jgi:hypothetical protein
VLLMSRRKQNCDRLLLLFDKISTKTMPSWQDEGHVVTSVVVHLENVCVIKGVLFDYNSVNHCS